MYGVVDSSVLVFGLSLNALLIFLIQTKTVESMKIYSKLLTLSAVVDMIVSFFSVLLRRKYRRYFSMLGCLLRVRNDAGDCCL